MKRSSQLSWRIKKQLRGHRKREGLNEEEVLKEDGLKDREKQTEEELPKEEELDEDE